VAAYPTYSWGGKLRRTAEDFEFPRVGARVVFQLWVLGDPARRFPPLRLLESVDLGEDSNLKQKGKRRRLCDLRTLMSVIETVRCCPSCDTHSPTHAARQASGKVASKQRIFHSRASRCCLRCGRDRHCDPRSDREGTQAPNC
jgi:hypothetical protein